MRLNPYAKCTIFDGRERIGKIDSKSQVKVLQLPDLDYFNNMASIEKLNQWCYGWSLKF